MNDIKRGKKAKRIITLLASQAHAYTYVTLLVANALRTLSYDISKAGKVVVSYYDNCGVRYNLATVCLHTEVLKGDVI